MDNKIILFKSQAYFNKFSYKKISFFLVGWAVANLGAKGPPPPSCMNISLVTRLLTRAPHGSYEVKSFHNVYCFGSGVIM